MKKITRNEMLKIQLEGFAYLVAQSFFVAWFGGAAFHAIAEHNGLVASYPDLLLHAWPSLMLLGLFPGQGFWSIRIPDRHNQLRTFIGAPTFDEQRYQD